METEFKREERYIVLKRKNLYPEQESFIRDLLEEMGVLTVECVVVESDWPESETVWKMIQDRIEGRPNELTAANDRIRELEAKLIKAKDIPMKYKRMEFNAQLQDENTSLRTALTAEREVSDKLEKALKRVVGDHNAPNDCYATGPLTGNLYEDLVSCPSCEAESLLAEVAAIRATHTSGEQA